MPAYPKSTLRHRNFRGGGSSYVAISKHVFYKGDWDVTDKITVA